MKLFQLLPKPTTAAAVNNFTFNPTLTQRTDQFDVRFDQNLGSSDRLFFRYGYDNSNQVVPGVIPAPADAGIGPYLVDGCERHHHAAGEPGRDARLYQGDQCQRRLARHISASSAGMRDITPLGGGFNAATALGIPGININDKSGGLPAFTITGFQEIGDNSTYPEDSQTTTFQLDSSVSMIRGSHTIKVGALFLRHRFNGFSAFPTRGTFDFNGQFTRQIGGTSSAAALADFALGATDARQPEHPSGRRIRHAHLDGVAVCSGYVAGVRPAYARIGFPMGSGCPLRMMCTIIGRT